MNIYPRRSIRDRLGHVPYCYRCWNPLRPEDKVYDYLRDDKQGGLKPVCRGKCEQSKR